MNHTHFADNKPITFSLGDTDTSAALSATVSIFTIGHLMANFAEWYGLSPDDVDDEIRPFLERPLPVPVQSILIKQADITLLVDAPRYDITDNSPFAIPGYEPPPGLVTQLAQVGTLPDEVTHVVITHPHFDHFNGLTVQKNGEYLPVFENARHFLAKMDWKMPLLQQAITEPNSMERNTLGVLHEQGLLELVTGGGDLGHGLEIVSAPGETPGHQIVRLTVGEQVLYCLGDLFHHELELLRPGTMVQWANDQAMVLSQHGMTHRALAENALLIASHIPGYGRLVRKDNKVRWAAEV